VAILGVVGDDLAKKPPELAIYLGVAAHDPQQHPQTARRALGSLNRTPLYTHGRSFVDDLPDWAKKLILEIAVFSSRPPEMGVAQSPLWPQINFLKSAVKSPTLRPPKSGSRTPPTAGWSLDFAIKWLVAYVRVSRPTKNEEIYWFEDRFHGDRLKKGLDPCYRPLK